MSYYSGNSNSKSSCSSCSSKESRIQQLEAKISSLENSVQALKSEDERLNYRLADETRMMEVYRDENRRWADDINQKNRENERLRQDLGRYR